MTAVRLSVILPTLNAAHRLPQALASLAPWPTAERIVVDGGSSDGSRLLAEQENCRLLSSEPGRGRQLAAGAEAASGDWLLFLHADTRLSPGWAPVVSGFIAAADSQQRAGFFRLRFDCDHPGARRIERLANWRAERLGLPYGDQALLISRTLYRQCGGFRPLPLMEDVELVRRLGRRRLKPLPAETLTSARKYYRDGWLARPAMNLCLLGLYLAGVPPKHLARLYR